jgi:drug/metabolite transporter (DMT)-like permease
VPHRRGVLLVAGAAIFWSSGALIARLVATDPWTTTLWRSVFAAAFLVVVVAAVRRQGVLAQWRAIGWPGLAVAACMATASICFLLSLSRTSVANTLILMSVGPWVAGLLGWIVLAERVRPHTWLTMGAALAGVVVMVSGSYGTGRLGGDALAIVMATVFALAIVLVRRHPDIQMTPAASLSAVIAAVVVLPMASPLAASPRDLALLAVFGAVQFGVGFLLFTAGARLIPVAQTSLIGMLETVLGPLWVWLVLGESAGVRTIVGGLVILAALALHTVFDMTASSRRAAEATSASRRIPVRISPSDSEA